MGPSLEEVMEWARQAYPLLASSIEVWLQDHPEHWGYLEGVCTEFPFQIAVQVIINIWFNPYGIASI